MLEAPMKKLLSAFVALAFLGVSAPTFAAEPGAAPSGSDTAAPKSDTAAPKKKAAKKTTKKSTKKTEKTEKTEKTDKMEAPAK